MDMLFFGDSANTSENHGGNHHAAVRYGMRWPKHDMMPHVPLMARAAPGVGIGLTMSTTYHHPFHVARLFNSLDHVTHGRIAWNAVTSAYKNEAANWGFDEMMEHDERYVRAKEHMHVACKLWDSVEQDAIVFDKKTGIFADPEKVHLINHRGKYFNVRGPLPVLPSPQGRPVLIQAGQSPAGIDLAASFAEMQFVSRNTIASMKQHRAALDERLIAHGRQPRDLGILWSLRVQVGDSEADAIEKERRYIASIPPEAGILELSHMYGLDFSAFPGDMPLSELGDAVQAQNVHWGGFRELVDTNDPSTTIADLGRKNAISRGLVVRGTPKEIADKLEEIHFETGANGGIILHKGIEVPGNLRDFVECVVPELQRRGLSKTRYIGTTLRENLA
jgi:FMN-dependent oxidoreductase (nitrilotriacetate monooxygenase family)